MRLEPFHIPQHDDVVCSAPECHLARGSAEEADHPEASREFDHFLDYSDISRPLHMSGAWDAIVSLQYSI